MKAVAVVGKVIATGADATTTKPHKKNIIVT